MQYCSLIVHPRLAGLQMTHADRRDCKQSPGGAVTDKCSGENVPLGLSCQVHSLSHAWSL